MIVPQLEPLGGADLKRSEVLMDALAEGLHGLAEQLLADPVTNRDRWP